MSRAIERSSRDRFSAGVADQAGNAWSAAATASSTSAGPELATRL
jgi:hypothetical protein